MQTLRGAIGVAAMILVALGRAAASGPGAGEPRTSPVEVERVTGLKGDDSPDQLGVPTVVHDGGRYRAWYVSRFGENGYAVYHAESADGVAFTENRLCFKGDRAPCRISGRPAVFKAGNTWRMVLTLYHAVEKDRDALVLLESSDGIRWGQARVLKKGTHHYRRPAVVKSGTEWWLIYERLEHDERRPESRYYRMTSRDGSTWEGQDELFTETVAGPASAAATLHIWFDRPLRRWCLLTSEPRGRQHRLMLRLSQDGREWEANLKVPVTLGLDLPASALTDMQSFCEGAGRTFVYWGAHPSRVSRAAVDLSRAVREAVQPPRTGPTPPPRT